METLTVIVPCLNEERGVAPTLDNIYAVVPELPVNVEVLLIDDGSIDGTTDQMERLCRRHPHCRMRRNPENVGVGRSVMSAYSEVADNSWVTVLPGDNELDFRSIHNFLKLRDEYDVVLGYLQNPVIRPMRRRIASASFRQIVNSLYGFDFRYLNGMKMYRIEVMRGLEVNSSGYAFTAELIAKAMLRNPSLRIGEAPFVARGRANGRSNAFRPTAIAKAVYEVIRGQRSVAQYRKTIIEEAELETDQLHHASSHEGEQSADRDSVAC